MALKYSTGARNGILDGGLNALFNGGAVDFYTGSPPADADAAPTGTLLATVSVPADAFGAAANGAISKAGTWTGSVAETGTAGWFRIRTASDAGGTSSTLARIDGTVGVDLTLDNASLVETGSLTLGTVTLTFPAS